MLLRVAVVCPIWGVVEWGTSPPGAVSSPLPHGPCRWREHHAIGEARSQHLPLPSHRPQQSLPLPRGVHGERGKDFSPCSNGSSCGLSPAQSDRCSLPPFHPTRWKTDSSRSDEIPLHPEWTSCVSPLGQIPACQDLCYCPTLSQSPSLWSRGACRYPGCVFPWQIVLEKLSLKENTCTWRFRSPPSSLPPSLSFPGLSQLLPAPSQACAAVPGSSPAWGRAWVPLLSESAQTPANGGGGKKAAACG